MSLLPITFVRSVGIAQPKIVADACGGSQWFLHVQRPLRRDDPRLHPTIQAIEKAGVINTACWYLNTGRKV